MLGTVNLPEAGIPLIWEIPVKITEDPAAELPFERIATSEPFLVLRTAIDHLSSLACKRSIPTRAAAIAYAPSLRLPAADLEQLAKLEAAIERHSTVLPPAGRLAALLADPILSPGWSAAAQAGRDSGDNDLAELASRITPYQTIGDYLASAHFEATDGQGNPHGQRRARPHPDHEHSRREGNQATIVFLPGWEENNFPIRWRGGHDASALEEERRLAYVALTRARAMAYLTSCVRRGNRTNQPSRFLAELGLTEAKHAA